MFAKRTSVWMSVMAVLSAGSAHAQSWVLDVPGVAGHPPSEGIYIRKLLTHPSGDLHGFGGRSDGFGELNGSMMRISLDATVGDAHQFVSPAALNFWFNDAVWASDDQVVCAGNFWESLVATPFLYAIDRTTGAVLWEENPTPEEGWLLTIEPLEGGTIAAGFVDGISESENDGYVVRVDAAGEVLWQKRYDQAGATEIFRDMVVREDGKILIASVSDAQLMLLELAPSGDVIEAREFDVPGTHTFAHIEPTDDGGVFLATASLYGVAGPHTIWVARLDAAGDISWQFEYRVKVAFNFELLATSDGGCAVSGGNGLDDDEDPVVLRLDADGSVEWFRRFSLISDDADVGSVELAELPDGGLLLSASSFDFPADERRLLLYRIDAEGGQADECWEFGGELDVARCTTAVVPVVRPMITGTVASWEIDLPVIPESITLDSNLLCGEPCPAPVPYCDTTPNSVGDGARMDWFGSTRVSTNDAVLTATGVPPGAIGVFLRAQVRGLTPLGDGQLCVAHPVHRIETVVAGPLGRSVSILDHGAPVPPGMEVLPGSEWNYQLWYRDPAGGPAGSNLSDGLSVRFCP